VLVGAGTLLFLPITDTSSFWRFGIAGLLLFSLGLAVFVAPITATALSSVSRERAGVASGVNSTISRLGNLLAVAVLGLVASLVFAATAGDTAAVPLDVDQTDPELRSASIDAFRVAMVVAAVLAFGGAAVAWFRISDADARVAGEEATAARATPGSLESCPVGAEPTGT
jgi:hypothetical protein